jgi:DNA-binding transcriptional ArsR family regulator
MVQRQSALVGDSFAALADDTRRGVLDQLGQADASISDLAAHFEMTLTGMAKHVRILEHAGLVATEKVGRVRYCRLGAGHLDDVSTWIEGYQQLWEARFRGLDTVIEEMQRKGTRGGSNGSE